MCVDCEQNGRVAIHPIICDSAGPVRELNPGPLAPEVRIMPLDQQAVEMRTQVLI